MTLEPSDITHRETYITPVDKLISDLEGTWYKMSEVAQITGLSTRTLRRWKRAGKVKAPSYQLRHGGLKVYLYNGDDVNEVLAYLRGTVKRETEINDG